MGILGGSRDPKWLEDRFVNWKKSVLKYSSSYYRLTRGQSSSNKGAGGPCHGVFKLLQRHLTFFYFISKCKIFLLYFH